LRLPAFCSFFVGFSQAFRFFLPFSARLPLRLRTAVLRFYTAWVVSALLPASRSAFCICAYCLPPYWILPAVLRGSPAVHLCNHAPPADFLSAFCRFTPRCSAAVLRSTLPPVLPGSFSLRSQRTRLPFLSLLLPASWRLVCCRSLFCRSGCATCRFCLVTATAVASACLWTNRLRSLPSACLLPLPFSCVCSFCCLPRSGAFAVFVTYAHKQPSAFLHHYLPPLLCVSPPRSSLLVTCTFSPAFHVSCLDYRFLFCRSFVSCRACRFTAPPPRRRSAVAVSAVFSACLCRSACLPADRFVSAPARKPERARITRRLPPLCRVSAACLPFLLPAVAAACLLLPAFAGLCAVFLCRCVSAPPGSCHLPFHWSLLGGRVLIGATVPACLGEFCTVVHRSCLPVFCLCRSACLQMRRWNFTSGLPGCLPFLTAAACTVGCFYLCLPFLGFCLGLRCRSRYRLLRLWVPLPGTRLFWDYLRHLRRLEQSAISLPRRSACLLTNAAAASALFCRFIPPRRAPAASAVRSGCLLPPLGRFLPPPFRYLPPAVSAVLLYLPGCCLVATYS